MPTTFVDQSGATPGTPLDASHLNGLVVGLTTANLDAAAGIVAGQVASVNGSALLKGVRQLVTYQPSSDINVDTTHQGVPSLTYGNWGHLVDIAITTASGSALLVFFAGCPWNYIAATSNWARMASALDGANVKLAGGQAICANAGPCAFNSGAATGGNGQLCGIGVWTGVSSGAHNVNLLMSGGGPGAQTSAGFRPNSAATDSAFSAIVVEFAP